MRIYSSFVLSFTFSIFRLKHNLLDLCKKFAITSFGRFFDKDQCRPEILTKSSVLAH